MPLFNSKITSDAQAAVESAVVTTAPVRLAGLAGDDVLAASSLLHAEAHPQGMVRPFLAHQAAAYLYATGSIERWGGALLGDDMGLGKTQVLLALVADQVAQGGYAIMVAPPVAIAGYRDDLAAAFPHLRFAHLKGRKPTLPEPADIYFISDDALTLKAWLVDEAEVNGKKVLTPTALATGAAMLTRDEIHRDKGNGIKPSTRSRVMLAVSEALRNAGTPVVGATGTILTNRPVEAYLPLQIVGGKALVKAVTPGASNAYGFVHRYCDPKHNGFGTDYSGCNLDEMNNLHEYLRRTVYVRREKRDLGDTLPHGGWVVKPIALNGVLTRYQRVERDFLNLVMDEEGPEAMWRKARAEAITRMQAMWEEAGVAKAQAAVEYVTDLTDQGRSVVVFYYHQRTFDALAKGLSKANVTTTVINGKVTGEQRADAIHDFQAGKAQVMLAQIRAAGMAVTLTAAADAVFVQVPWSAGDLKQAADRILRADQRSLDRAKAGEAVTWHVLTACYDNGDPTFDAVMWGILERKAQVCDAVNAGRPITMPAESVMLEALTAWYPQAQQRKR